MVEKTIQTYAKSGITAVSSLANTSIFLEDASRLGGQNILHLSGTRRSIAACSALHPILTRLNLIYILTHYLYNAHLFVVYLMTLSATQNTQLRIIK
jgi:hypothetical protein